MRDVKDDMFYGMGCVWCHEGVPINRDDGYCSDICKEWYTWFIIEGKE